MRSSVALYIPAGIVVSPRKLSWWMITIAWYRSN